MLKFQQPSTEDFGKLCPTGSNYWNQPCIHFFLGVGVKLCFWPANVALAIVALQVTLMLFVPQTRQWLLMKEQKKLAWNNLQWLRGSEADQIE